ncbi:MAG: tetratricopeptide repeat protein [Actinobacteria bacterium]|nr:MAG: tetratricopeptide repeat protein [Actinomycetota bacterium]
MADPCSSGAPRSPRCSSSSTTSSPGAASTALQRSRPTRFWAARTSIRVSDGSTKLVTSWSARRRSAASWESATASRRHTGRAPRWSSSPETRRLRNGSSWPQFEIGVDAPLWKSNRARALARLGRIDDAVELAREAANSIARSDNITSEAEVLVHLAEVMRAAGDADDASEALTQAVALHQEKGNILNAEQCRQLLANEPATGAGA